MSGEQEHAGDPRTNEQIIAEARREMRGHKGPYSDRIRTLADALEASEAARANIEAVIAEAAMAMEKGLAEGITRSALVMDVLTALSRAGDPVVLREHDAKVLRDAADAYDLDFVSVWLHERADDLLKEQAL